MANFAYVQQTQVGLETTPTTITVSFPNDNTVGNCIIFVVLQTSTPSSLTISDSQGNTYVGPIQGGSVGGESNLYVALNINGGPNAVTLTDPNGTHFSLAVALEYSSADSYYFACPGGTSLTSGAASTLSNYVNSAPPGQPSGYTFNSASEVLAICFGYLAGGGSGTYLTLPPATFRVNYTIGSYYGDTFSVADIDQPNMLGSWTASPFQSVVAGSPSGISQSFVIFLSLTGCSGGALAITCGNPPGGIVGSPYAHSFPATGGTAPYTFSILSGSLPAGLTLNSASGSVTGVPTTTATVALVIQVMDSVGATASVACSISISAAGAWIIQEITAELIPCYENLGSARGHFRYTVRCVDSALAGTYLGWWESFGGGGGGGTESAGGVGGIPLGPPGAPPVGPSSGSAGYAQTFSSVTSVTVNHGLGTVKVIVQCYDAGSPQLQFSPASVKVTSGNQVVVDFGGVTMSGEVVVIGFA